MTTALIFGSGPAAAGAALALSRRENRKIVVIDIGLRLETEHGHSRRFHATLRTGEPRTRAGIAMGFR